MAFFDDFSNAVSAYPATYVKISIEDKAVVTGTASAINVNEVWSFEARVRNTGPLNMRGVMLHVHADNGAKVSTSSAGPWLDVVTITVPNVNARSTQDSVKCFLKAPSTPKPVETRLAYVHISAWDANLDYILNTQSTLSATPEVPFKSQVFP
jgi:hypothetical protein